MHLERRTQGAPFAVELALMVVNEAVLQLTGYRPPDLVKMVYAEQSISTRWADSRSDVSLAAAAAPEEKGFGFGGGFLEGAGDTRVRTNFQPVAYYNGALQTDAAGTPSVDVYAARRPDDVAHHGARVHDRRALRQRRHDVPDDKAVDRQSGPAAFARPGDTMNAGVSVTNTAKATGTLDIQGVLSGGLAFVENGQQVPTASLSQPVDATDQGLSLPDDRDVRRRTVRMKFGVELGTRERRVPSAALGAHERL